MHRQTIKNYMEEKGYMEKYNKNDDTWVCDYNVYPEQGYYITNKKKNEYR